MAIVWDYVGSNVTNTMQQLSNYLAANWTWNGGTDVQTGGIDISYFWMDTNKNVELSITNGVSGSFGGKITIKYKGTTVYTNDDFFNSKITFKVEIGFNILIISFANDGSFSGGHCEKIIICNGTDFVHNKTEQIMIYLGSLASSNVYKMIASDLPGNAVVSMSTMDGNANVNSLTTNLIPFWTTNSAFVTTDVFMSVCTNLPTWFFSNIILNETEYRMSGSVYFLDE